jgi:signal transduction histidine kinase
MQERVAALGGRLFLQAGQSLERGLTLELKIPLVPLTPFSAGAAS